MGQKKMVASNKSTWLKKLGSDQYDTI